MSEEKSQIADASPEDMRVAVANIRDLWAAPREENRRRLWLALLPLTSVLLLSACAQSAGNPGGPINTDPYHYREPFQAGA